MKKLRILTTLAVTAILTNCGTSGGTYTNSAPTQTVTLPNYSVYDEEIYDAPIKTQVTTHIVIAEGEITEEMIRNLLTKIYEQTMKRTGFESHPNPTSTYIYAYTSTEKAKSGMGQWVGMISKSHTDTKPSISISETQMNAMNEIEETKWGLTYELRQEIWNELIKSEDRAQKEAEKKYPLDKPGLTLNDMKKTGALSNELNEKYDKEIANKYGVKIEIMDSVSLEGVVNGWAFPEYE